MSLNPSCVEVSWWLACSCKHLGVVPDYPANYTWSSRSCHCPQQMGKTGPVTFKQAQNSSLILSLPLICYLSLKKIGEMVLLLTCLQAVGDSWVLPKYKAVKCSVLGPHPEQTSTDLQKVDFPGVHLSGPPCGLSDGHPPETYPDFHHCDSESTPPSTVCWFYVLSPA